MPCLMVALLLTYEQVFALGLSMIILNLCNNSKYENLPALRSILNEHAAQNQ